ncbi:enoyl-CoA hydratase/isomerase family protein [Amycolatopsis australiensis]|uniref:Enoyl-CoA hydratase n=1 Tax=Amycolatopsis australiensis TaxID=546364 RepID=A0A1K1SQE8_9PSEU|nr:enoyl-CoA hydratase/isomerase family protein [Amycolatopsis australiensis]SFW86510.1 enoyl-CoA hydratase [Amycolatopsis australiensis]
MPIDDLRPAIDWGKYQTLTIERRDTGILLITIAEPDGYPAPTLTRRHTEISCLWRDFADDPDLRVAVITGRGERFWTVEGNDGIDEMLQNPGNYNNTVNLIREGLTNAHGIVNCDKPIISAINGEAMGSGLATALLADISVASTDARLIDGHLLQGIAAGDHSVMIWPLLCGLAKAKLYLLASADLTGEVAERIGLVSLAVPPGDVLDTALGIAQRMAAGPQHALRWTKRSLNHWLRTAVPAFEASIAFEAMSFFGPDLVEALTAQVENRSPRFAEPLPW